MCSKLFTLLQNQKKRIQAFTQQIGDQQTADTVERELETKLQETLCILRGC